MPWKYGITCKRCGRHLGYVVYNGHIWDSQVLCDRCARAGRPQEREEGQVEVEGLLAAGFPEGAE